jgi:hypothetical protein
VPQEVKRFLRSIQYPRLLGIESQAKPVKNLPGLFQIEIWPFFAQNDKVIGVAHEMSIVGAFAEFPSIPNLVQPVQVEVSK